MLVHHIVSASLLLQDSRLLHLDLSVLHIDVNLQDESRCFLAQMHCVQEGDHTSA